MEVSHQAHRAFCRSKKAQFPSNWDGGNQLRGAGDILAYWEKQDPTMQAQIFKSLQQTKRVYRYAASHGRKIMRQNTYRKQRYILSYS
jgi:hypothetical protein